MAEKQFKYTTTIKQPQTVGVVKLDPNGGTITEREYKAVKKDPYGASLLEKALLVVVPAEEPAPPPSGNEGSGDEDSGDNIPDFDASGGGSEQ
jgi:hypothetical protein